jgi:hypothetical protein
MIIDKLITIVADKEFVQSLLDSTKELKKRNNSPDVDKLIIELNRIQKLIKPCQTQYISEDHQKD